MALDNAYPTAATTLSTMTQWEAFFVGMGVGAGVVGGLNGELAPSINSGARTVSFGTGAAVLRGFYVNAASTTTTGVPTQDAQNRVDRLVLRLDRTAVTAAAWVTAVIIKGTAGSTNPPAIQNTTNGSWDFPLCRWTTNSNGTLSGLVDERYFLGGGYTEFFSTARPSASPPRMGRERDTGRLLYADGSTWNLVTDDTGWVNITPTGHWTVGGYQPQIRCRAGVVYLRGSVARAVDTLQSTVTNSPIATVGSAFFPAGAHNYASITSAASPVRLQVSLSGDVALVDAAADIAVGRGVYLDTTYLKG